MGYSQSASLVLTRPAVDASDGFERVRCQEGPRRFRPRQRRAKRLSNGNARVKREQPGGVEAKD